MRPKHFYFLSAMLGVVAGAVFTVRGPSRGLSDSHDFGTIYAASRGWLHGRNPYDHAVISDEWAHAGGPPERAPSPSLTPSVYPPTAFVVTAPFAVLPWPTARAAWCATNVALIGLLIEAVRRLAGFAWREPRALCLAAATLALRPVSSAVEVGQPSLLATALGAWALVAVGADRRRLAGWAHAAGLATKVTVAAAFVVPDVVARRWRPAVIALASLAACAGLATLRADDPAAGGRSWVENLRVATAPGGVNDPSTANPSRHQLVNLHYPLSSFVGNAAAVNLVTWVVVGALAAPAAVGLWRRPTGAALLLPVGMVAMAQALAVYHRMYDATVLVFPLAWALLPSTPSWQRWPTLGLLLVFVVPGSPPPATDSWARNPFWNWVVVPREAWALLLLLAWAACCQCRDLARPARVIAADGGAAGARPATNLPAVPGRS